MATSRELFSTVARKDYLGFWADQKGVAPSSVRFDQKIPKEVLDRLQEIANLRSGRAIL